MQLRTKLLDGRQVLEMFAAATSWLEVNADSINALNVFPVPDGDTGTNMLLTMRSALEGASPKVDGNVSEALQALSKGALMGARGNSGVILSQILRGLATASSGKVTLSGPDLAAAFEAASNSAYKAVTRPVEGTILTVIREVAKATGKQRSSLGCDITSVLDLAAETALESVARTPSLLQVLRDAEVVDAGGQGLYILLDGAAAYIRGEKAGLAPEPPGASPPQWVKEEHYDSQSYGFCTEFFIKGKGLSLPSVREQIASMGNSAIVIGDSETIKVHIHTFDPDAALKYAASVGKVERTKVDNIDQQHRNFVAAKRDRQGVKDSLAVVAVASGDGIADVLRSLGASVIPGGQTMNPSAQDIVAAVEAAPSSTVIVLPNNKNVVLTAQQAQTLTSKKLVVVPTETIPQGVSAMVAFNKEAALPDNVSAMDRARASVTTLEITRAVRSARVGDIRIEKGQAIGLADGELKSTGQTPLDALKQLLEKTKPCGILTIYTGSEADPGETQAAVQWAKKRFAGAEIEVVAGGQPHYSYIVSVE